MNRQEKLELARWVVSRAKSNGANEAAAVAYSSRDISVNYREKMVEELRESTSNSLNLSIYAKNRYSSHTTNDLRRDALDKFTAEAVAMTKYLSEDPDRSLPDPKYYEGQRTSDLKQYDASYESLQTEERVRLAAEVEEAARARNDRIITMTSYFSDSSFESVRVASNGFEGARNGTSFSLSAEVSVRGEGDGRPSGWADCTVRFRNNLVSPEIVAQRAVDDAVEKIGQTKMASGVYDMVVWNRAANRLLRNFYRPMQGSSLYRKNSFLDEKLGERVGSEKLTWIDDPFVEAGLGSRLYDGEGLAAKRRVMIEKGILKSYYLDTYYARKLGVEPTTAGTSNVVMEYGDKALEDLVGMVKKGILVTSFIGGNSNSTTGDFSTGIMGKYIEDGKIVKPVNEMNVTGNHNEFWNQLVEVGNDPYPYSSWRRPSLFFKEVQFSGL